METLTEQDYLTLRDLYEGAHGMSMIKLSRYEGLLGGYFTGASTVFDLLEHANWGENYPKTLTDLDDTLRVPPHNNGVDNACAILRRTREVLQVGQDQLPKWAALVEVPLWCASDELNIAYFEELKSFQKLKYEDFSIPDYAIVARWRLSLGI